MAYFDFAITFTTLYKAVKFLQCQYVTAQFIALLICRNALLYATIANDKYVVRQPDAINSQCGGIYWKCTNPI